MPKIICFVLLATLLLAGCTTAATQAPTIAPTATLPPLPTQVVQQCTVEASLPKAEPDESNRFAPVTEADWILGAPDAKITLLEYSDYM